MSIEIVAPVATRPSTTGSTRRSSSSSGHGVGAGAGRLAADVEHLRALADQPAAVLHGGVRVEVAPPSENESGVTLTTPMIV